MRPIAIQPRQQNTIAQTAIVRGIGFITGADVELTFRPAEAGFGIQFQRLDLHGTNPIAARIDNTIPRDRRTAISQNGVTIELTEHVLAALYALQVDNCLVTLNAAEPPGCDGSAEPFVEALKHAGFVPQSQLRPIYRIDRTLSVVDENSNAFVVARPARAAELLIHYELDYGPTAPFSPQSRSVSVTAESFTRDLAFARTFILEEEIEALRALGYGRRTTFKDLIVFGSSGVIDNELHVDDECVRHKLLDCVGDFALVGCDLVGEIHAIRSGHSLNRELARKIAAAAQTQMNIQHEQRNVA